MKTINLILISIIFSLFVEKLLAQDPTFSQFYANRAYLNPAFIGMQDGISFTLSEREQWIKVPKRYSTTSASVELKPCHWPMAFGLNLFRDNEGEGDYLNQGLNFSYSHVFALSKIVNLHFGTRLGFTNKSVNWFNLHFSDEIDPVYGFTTETGAQPTYNRLTLPTIDFGTVIRFKMPSPGYRKTDIKSAIGLSYNHPFQPIQSLYDGRSHILPKRITIHGGTQIPFASAPRSHYKQREDRKYYFIPNFKIELQSADSIALNKSFSWGAYIQTPLSFYIGVFYQHNNWTPQRGIAGGLNASSFIILTGYDTYIKDVPVVIGLSYDTQPLGLPTGISGGSLEVTLRFRLEELRMTCNPGAKARRFNKKSGRYIMDCNNFF